MSGEERRLDVPADEVAGSLAARRQLGQDSEEAVIAAFLDRAGDAIDRRVEDRLAESGTPQRPVVAPDDPEARKDARNLAIWSIVLAVPITGVSSQFGDTGPIVAIASWLGITAINISFNRRRYR